MTSLQKQHTETNIDDARVSSTWNFNRIKSIQIFDDDDILKNWIECWTYIPCTVSLDDDLGYWICDRYVSDMLRGR